MKTPPPPDLRAALGTAGAFLLAPDGSVRLNDLLAGHALSVPPGSLEGANILLRTQSQLAAALALIALDGIAARLVIAPPDLKDEHLPGVIARAGLDTLVSDGDVVAGLKPVMVSTVVTPGAAARTRTSEWILFTSGTTGMPKMVSHSLASLAGAIRPTDQPILPEKTVWGTFYDIRRYGGLQILLRAVLGGTSLVLPQADEKVGDFLARLGEQGVTHLTGTPSHWRRALMSPAISRIAPRSVRLSGEIADQAVLDSLKTQFPQAAITHAYASTEAGVGFEVADGREGFPAAFVGREGEVEMKIVDGALHLRSPRTAASYVGSDDRLGEGGWVDTGDMVEQRRSVRASESDQNKDRFYFAGRRGGIINVGGLKIHPEEVEAVINRHPGVRLSRVSGRKDPVLGALVVADVVLVGKGDKNFPDEILSLCRAALPPFKVPAMVRVVDTLDLTAGGKLARHG